MANKQSSHIPGIAQMNVHDMFDEVTDIDSEEVPFTDRRPPKGYLSGKKIQEIALFNCIFEPSV